MNRIAQALHQFPIFRLRPVVNEGILPNDPFPVFPASAFGNHLMPDEATKQLPADFLFVYHSVCNHVSPPLWFSPGI